MDEKVSDMDTDAFFRWSAVFSGAILSFGVILFALFPQIIIGDVAAKESLCSFPAAPQCSVQRQALSMHYSDFTQECFCSTVRSGLGYMNIILALVFVSSATGWIFSRVSHRNRVRHVKSALQ